MTALDVLDFEVRADPVDGTGRTILGTIAPFGVTALGARNIPEQIMPGAIDVPVEVPLVVGHRDIGGGMATVGPQVGTAQIFETPDGYKMRAVVDEDHSAFYAEVRHAGAALSIGFNALLDPVVAGVRQLQKIALGHVAAVGSGAYTGAVVAEVRAEPQPNGDTMSEATEAAAVAETPTETVESTEVRSGFSETEAEVREMRDQMAELTRSIQAQTKITETDERFEVRAARNVKSAGEWMYHAARVLDPDGFGPGEGGRSADLLGLTEAEVRQAVTASGDTPIPAPLLGPIEDLIRSGRPYASALGSFPLPAEGGMTIERHVVTAGSAAEWEGSEGSDGGSNAYATTPVLAGIHAHKLVNGLTLQASLRSNPTAVDGLLRDQASEMARSLDDAVINGDGALGSTIGSLAGIVNDPDVVDVAYVGLEIDPVAFMAAWTEAYIAVVTGTNRPPRFAAMPVSVWGALLGMVDESGRPIIALDGNPSVNTIGAQQLGDGGTAATGPQNPIFGSIQYVPVIVDQNVASGTLHLVGQGSFELYEGAVLSASLQSPVNFVTEYGGAQMASLIPIRGNGTAIITAIPDEPFVAAKPKGKPKGPKQAAA